MVKELEEMKAELSELKESKEKYDAILATLERAEAHRTSRRVKRYRHRTLSYNAPIIHEEAARKEVRLSNQETKSRRPCATSR